MKLLVRVLGGLFALICVVAAGLAWRVAAGPVSLEAFKPQILEALNREAAPLQVDVAEVLVAWREGHFVLLVRNLNVHDGDRAVVQLPQAAIGFDAGHLLAARLEPRTLYVDQPRLVLERSVDGAIGLRLADDAAPGGAEAPSLMAGDDLLGGLDRIKVVGAEVTLRDAQSGRTWVLPDVTTTATRDADQLHLEVEATMQGATVRLDGSLAPDFSGAFDLALSDLIPGRFAALHPLLVKGTGIEVPVSGTGRVVLGPGAVTTEAALDLVIAAGPVRQAMPEDPLGLEIDGGTLTLGWDGSRLAVDATLGARGAQLAISGQAGLDASGTGRASVQALVPDRFADLAPTLAGLGTVTAALSGEASFTVQGAELVAADVALKAEPGNVPAPGQPETTLKLDRGAIDATFRDGVWTVPRIALTVGGFVLDGTARAVPGPRGLSLEADLKGGALPVSTLLKLWPQGVSEGGRGWIAENITVGGLTSVTATLRLPSGFLHDDAVPADAVQVQAGIANLTARYMEGMPPGVGLDGSAELNAAGMTVQVDKGHIDVPDSGRLDLVGGQIVLTGFDSEGQQGDFRAELTGQTATAMALINQPRLAYADRFGIQPTEVAGTQRTRVRFQMPLIEDLPIESVDLEVKAQLSGFGLPDIVAGHALSDGEVALEVNRVRAVAKGDVRLGGVPMRMTWDEDFEADPGAPTSSITARFRLDARDRALFGLDLAPNLTGIAGDVDFDLALVGRGPDIRRITGKADLTPTELAPQVVDWTKPRGRPAGVDFTAEPKPGGSVEFTRVRLEAEGLTMDARVSIGADGSLSRLAIDRLHAGETDGAFYLNVGADGGWSIEARAASIDLRRLIAELKDDRSEDSADDGLPDFRLGLRIDKALLEDGRTLSNITGIADHGMGRWQSAAVDARTTTGALQIRVGPRGNGRLFRLTSDDGGAMLALVGVTDQAKGGRFELSLQTDDRAPMRPGVGRIVIDNFKIVDAPILARLLTLGSLTGIAAALGGEGIAFTRLVVPFTQTGSIYRVTDARAFGESLGLTIAGTVDRQQDTMSLAGAIVPSYYFNSAVADIPLLGPLLGGGGGAGLIAFNYSMVGPIDNLSLGVNPLSALTPGFLRDIMGVLDGSGAAASGPAPAAVP
ncbi:YhdP family protein [Zavarzinia sp. CC-PAN008]|uniref:YhdP family protein n=1 Tax=Zavarzinia sp. CC-PAN008 TaxID=3243332 RepID=UPI003F7436DB